MPEKKNKGETAAERRKTFHEELVTQLLTLVTSGFGVVAALAWNEAIQQTVKEVIEPKIPGSGLFYRFLYAILITFLIVLITYQLSRISARFQSHKVDNPGRSESDSKSGK